MGGYAAGLIFGVPQAVVGAAQQFDPLLYIQNSNAVALQLGGLLVIAEQHFFHFFFYPAEKPLPVSIT